MSERRMPTAWIIAILLLFITGLLYVAEQIDNTIAFALVMGAVILFILGQAEKYKISFKEAVRILEKELIDAQRMGIVQNGDLKFSNEGDPTWDGEGNILTYDIIFEVRNETLGTAYYMGRVSIYGSWLGMTKLKRDSSIMNVKRDVKKVTFKKPEIVQPRKEISDEVKDD